MALEFHTGGTGVPMGVGTRVSYKKNEKSVSLARVRLTLLTVLALYSLNHVDDLPGEGSQTLLRIV